MSDILSAAGIVIVAAAAAAAILLPPGRARSVAMLIALALFPALIAGDQWHSPQVVDLRHDSARLAALLIAAAAITGILAAAFRRWPIVLPLAIAAALPFRIPLHAGGDTANLLVPLYLVIAAGVLCTALGRLSGRQQGWGVNPGAASRFSHHSVGESQGAPGEKPSHRIDPPSLLPYALAAVVVLYALQGLYSPDFSKAIQNVCFFLVPFSLAYALLRDARWDRRLLVLVLAVLAVEGIAFVLVGAVEYLTRSLFWNDQVIRSNEFHTYFRVNSVFWDPNIYGRYLALVIVAAMAVLLWARERRAIALLTGLVTVLWLGLFPTFSQSSFIALLAGLAVLAGLRWSGRWTLRAAAAVAVAAVFVVLLVGGSKITGGRINVDTSGRANLVSGGTELFAQRPVWGYGSGSFPRAYREHVAAADAPVSVSHTEPVTVAAEQGLIGLAAYAALLTLALWTLGAGLVRELREPDPDARLIGRAAVLAVFVALLVHTMAYAGFFEDPITWLLLAMGVSLAAVPGMAREGRPPGRITADRPLGGAVEPTV